ncbi:MULTISPECIES: terpene synthase family protein [Chryseobacterium]|uniref:Terpene synthase n=1 Tax=Chryseobacterium geocarposphaerae TaxID=1416776 RepID=A0ABU1LIK4_9FLAO|nr:MULTISPECIES: terpene synthase family protein [Chryseobacterium]MDR6406380.1 hypothetical protein [Chryseobacterium geocarposphaerae]MDR6699181.1 hypothetical protein [Chryseobacterium ginsenosidimutans]
MNTNTTPQITYPFPVKISPHGPALEKIVDTWIDEYTCFTPSFNKQMKAIKVGHVIATYFPNATFDQGLIIAQWIIWAFIIDDYYSYGPLEELPKATQRILEILQGGDPQPQDNDIVRRTAVVRDALLPHVSPAWMKREIEGHKYWFEGMLMEAEYCRSGGSKFPLLKDYMDIRVHALAGYETVNLADIITGFMPPEEILQNPVLVRLRYLFSRITALCNDVFSVKKDLKNGDTMNIVLVIQHEWNCTLEEAKAEAINMHNRDVQEFVAVRSSLPDVGSWQEKFEECILNMELMMSGHLAWYQYSERYL